MTFPSQGKKLTAKVLEVNRKLTELSQKCHGEEKCRLDGKKQPTYVGSVPESATHDREGEEGTEQAGTEE
jgi:hypothetical protein